MNFRLRSVALMAAALLWSASTATAETWTAHAYLSPTAANARVKWYKMGFMGGSTIVGQGNMTAQTYPMPIPFVGGATVPMYVGHTATLVTSDFISAATVQYEDPISAFRYASATVSRASSLVPPTPSFP